MGVSLQYLQRCSNETGYAVTTLEKVTRLGEIAGEIARHPLLGSALALKGGTALNLCFGDAPKRMSVDLDYNYIAHPDRERMLADRPVIEGTAEEITRRLGYRIQRSSDDGAGRKLFANYRSVLGTDDRVEVDLNFQFRVPLDGPKLREMWQPGELDRPRIQIVSEIELCAGKLLALLDRAAPRDAWDAARLSVVAGDVLQTARFRAIFIGMSIVLPHPIHTYTRDRMSKLLTKHIIESQLLPMLVEGDAVNAESLVHKAWDVVAPYAKLNPEEMKYVTSAQKGELRPELLLPSQPGVVAILAKHPSIQWKITNAWRHRSGKGPSGPD